MREHPPLRDTTTYIVRGYASPMNGIIIMLMVLFAMAIILGAVTYFDKPKPKSKTIQELQIENLELQNQLLIKQLNESPLERCIRDYARTK